MRDDGTLMVVCKEKEVVLCVVAADILPVVVAVRRV